ERLRDRFWPRKSVCSGRRDFPGRHGAQPPERLSAATPTHILADILPSKSQRSALVSVPVLVAMALLVPAVVQAKDFGLFDVHAGEARRFGADDLLRPWRAFTDLWLVADMAMVLMVAVLLGAVIAYHPT